MPHETEMTMRFSANLGFLWRELPLSDAIRAAASAGFAAVECHGPYETPADQVLDTLEETGLPLLGLNTRRTDDMPGYAAVPGQEMAAKETIEEALAYAKAVGAGAVHVLAGTSEGPDAHSTFIGNLRYAVEKAIPIGVTILIEPLNAHDAPGYFLRTTDQAKTIVEEIGSRNLRLMFDCYHVARTEGDVTSRLRDLAEIIGHIQFAGVPDRGFPDAGLLDYQGVFGVVREIGWVRPLGAEYIVPGRTEDSLGWMKTLA